MSYILKCISSLPAINFVIELPTVKYSIKGLSWWSSGLRLQAPNAGGLGSIPGQGTRTHMPQRSCEQLRSGAANKYFKIVDKLNELL